MPPHREAGGKKMTIHVEFEEDQEGQVTDIDYYCSALCYEEDIPEKSSYGQEWPCGSETDYDVYCSNCNELLWRGLEYANRKHN